MIILSLAIWSWRDVRLRLRPDPEAQIQPDKQYTVIYWDFDRPVGGEGCYRTELQQKIDEFEQLHPNIAIEPRMFSWAESEQVAAAIQRRQDLPQVLSLGSLDLDLDCSLFVPADYVSAKEKENYLPLVQDSFQLQCGAALWPRFWSPQLYLASVDLLQAAGVSCSRLQAEGIGWEDLLRIGEQLASLPGQPSVLAGLDFRGLLLSLAPRQLDQPSAGLNAWPAQAEDLATVRLQQLQADKLLPVNIDPHKYSGLDEFFTGQAAFLAPAEPWLVRMVWERQKRIEHGFLTGAVKGPQKVALIPPKTTSVAGLPARLEGLVVIKEHRAADEIRAAAEWARYLSRAGDLAAKLDFLPVYGPSSQAWAAKWELGAETMLLELCLHNLRLPPYLRHD
ncbi:MAG: hypothetical protein GX952_02215 [Firmicutes bacterium]|nr:hypothetical protein [Bacillota bacterium]